ncbi:MAG: transposase [Proteiniphilum sp.]|nr:transposase [Proteiniphilum sp.]
MRKIPTFLSDDKKLQVVQEYLNTDITQKELLIKYNLGGKQNINNWIRKFGLSSSTKVQIYKKRTMTDKTDKYIYDRSSELIIKKLEKELEHERLKNLALNTVIDIAEEDLKINIRKKSGAKQ